MNTHQYFFLQRAPLNIAQAYIRHQPVNILFDKGSQINMISHTLIRNMRLHIERLNTPVTIQGANSHKSSTQMIAPQITFTVSAYTQRKKHIELEFTCEALVANSQFDMLLGLPFIQRWNLVYYYCNNTIINISPTGQHLTIPLIHSVLMKQCRHNHFPFSQIRPLYPDYTSYHTATKYYKTHDTQAFTSSIVS